MSGSDSQDSDGEDLSTIRPTLIRELRNILDLYPDDGQILKELIQNAEDAGASEVKVVTDGRCFNQDYDQNTLKKHPHIEFLRGPALCVYNNAEFTERDWEGIRMLHTSIKEEDPLKVGRFGLGFKSVFHLADRLLIMSGDYLLYMDPFKGEDRYCKRHRVAGRKGKELQSLLQCLDGVLGVSSNTFREATGHFQGTLFWFPLRQNASELSETVYSEQHVQSLLKSFKAEAPSLLLFLTRIQRVTLLNISAQGGSPQETFTVGLSHNCVGDVEKERRSFLQAISENGLDLPVNTATCVTHVVMETRDHVTDEWQDGQWLIVNYHSGQREMSRELSALCSNPQLSYRPCVGVAVPLTDMDQFQSQVFCFLPLPLDTRSPTGLPVHVHGYLALEQNRRHVKWPPADQLTNQDPQCQWNALLVSEVLPKAFAVAIVRLQQMGIHQETYAAWPDVAAVSDRWRPLLSPLYNALVYKPLFFSVLDVGQWVSLQKAVLQQFPSHVSAEIRKTVVKVYTLNRQPLVDLPEHVYQTLSEFSLLRSVRTITESETSRLVRSVVQNLSREEKLHVLHYLTQHDVSLLEDLALLPLANGQFTTFQQRNQRTSPTFWCPGDMVQLFPGLEGRFCDASDDVSIDLHEVAESGLLSLELLTDPKDSMISTLIQQSIDTKFPHRAVAIDDDWLKHVWRFLTANRVDLGRFRSVQILPLKKSELYRTSETYTLLPLEGLYICKSAPGMALPQELASALSRLGATVLPQLPDFVRENRQIMPAYVQYPNDDGVMHILAKLQGSQAVRRFNSGASSEEKSAVVQFICRANVYSPLLRQLQLFTSTNRSPASVEDMGYIAPDDVPPIIPKPMLACKGQERKAAGILGATESSLQKMVVAVLKEMTPQYLTYSKDQITTFMQYVLNNNGLVKDETVTSLAREVAFVQTQSGTCRVPEDLYNPTSQSLSTLLQARHDSLFPHGQWAESEMLNKLQKLGLRDVESLKEEDMISAARSIQDMWQMMQIQAMQTADALWEYLVLYGNKLGSNSLRQLANIQCLPCLQDKPYDYPDSLPFKSTPQVVKPSEMAAHCFLSVTGSATPIARDGLKATVSQKLGIMLSPELNHVLLHLDNITKCYTRQDASKYKSQLRSVLKVLTERRAKDRDVTVRLREMKCVLVDTGDTFVRPDQLCLERGDVDLKTYRFVPQAFDSDDIAELLVACGSARTQDDSLLHKVLAEIQQKYKGRKSAHGDYQSDLKLVKHILEKLCENGESNDGNTLLPVVTDTQGVLSFRMANECTVALARNNRAVGAVNETYHFVLPDIDPQVAEGLGALPMTERALTGVEDIDYEYDEFEQHEDLTTRLHELLDEAYTDGFSVPKELVQNADDAGATEVRFLLDERENRNLKSTLISENMASLQGPAIWAYNNATFSDDDFKNIVRMGAGTKKEDVSKVGRFGLGFSAVYNFTEVPCFLSRQCLAMFDPQRKYLHKGGGMKLDFRKAINKDLLMRYPDQFEPFRKVFECKFENGLQIDGTLFRFPLRTSEQASESLLKNESYSPEKQKEFLKMLLERAGNVLMFTQNVREIHVYHLSKNSTDPGSMKCLLSVRKSSDAPILVPQQIKLNNKTIMHYFKDYWGRDNTDIKLSHQIHICHTVTGDAKDVCGVDQSDNHTRWQIAWASGVGRSSEMALQYWKHEGLVPVAAVAMSLTDHGLKPLSEGPPGFYKKGHLYCFLPLPDETSNIELPVHVNGMFALTSDRRGLLVQTEDDLDNRGSSWNAALYGDAICRAYSLLFELIKKEAIKDSDYHRYFDLWPTDHSVPALVNSFYQRLQSDGCAIFPVPSSTSTFKTRWISVQDARFLDPGFRDSDCGKFAWDALQRFWSKPGSVVDVPSRLCHLIEQGCGQVFKNRVISELEFYRDYFFPNLASDWWQVEQRDRLVFHALMHEDKNIQELVKDKACIPCQGSKKLRTPDQLVSPNGKVASLFLLQEARFPQAADKEKTTERHQPSCVDFCEHNALKRLSSLGMVTDTMPWYWVVERAQSVETLLKNSQTDQALKRATCLIQYLSDTSDELKRQCTDEEHFTLSQIDFLPVLQKPQDWLLPWAGDESCLGNPAELSSDSLCKLVACSVKLLDTKALDLIGVSVFTNGKPREVLRWLGVKVDEDYSDFNQIKSAEHQLATISEYKDKPGVSSDQLRTISSGVYAYLSKCLTRDQTDQVKDEMSKIIRSLSNKEIIFTRNIFCSPSHVAFSSWNCPPYLFQLEESLQSKQYRAFFEAVGVKEKFEVHDVLGVLGELKEKHGNRQLPGSTIDCVKQLASLLESIAQTSSLSDDDKNRTFLPDFNRILRKAPTLCVDDCPWLAGLKTVHGSIAKDTALLLGVTTKKKQHFAVGAKPIRPKAFGQTEKLTTRISRLLQGYAFDSTLFMELLQNADDAGATECKLIMDFRHLGTKTIPEKWEALQGPALCFYDNKSFTSKDIEGIQKLGEGNSWENAMKTGQFGVGFNAVFHITDVPSFWTKVDDAEETVCIFDPNNCYVPETEPGALGAQFTAEMIKSYPDMMAGYLGNFIDMKQSGTLFRFPLRTDKMAESSKIKSNEVSELEIIEMLDSFQEEMGTCLLFLNSLHTVGIYSVTEEGELNKEFEVTKTLDGPSSQHLKSYRHTLERASDILEQEGMTLDDIETREEVAQCRLTDSHAHEEEWLTVHRVGFKEAKDLPQELSVVWKDTLKLLPRGGVAFKIKERSKTRPPKMDGRSKKDDHKLFCILPLPVITSLPMHVNGHFALDHETRRNLLTSKDKKEDVRSKWNEAVAMHIIVPAYVTALLRAREIFLSANRKPSPTGHGLRHFHDLFPSPKKAHDEFWKNMIYHLYKTLAEKERPVFPVMSNGNIEWVPAVKRIGFPGYFNKLIHNMPAPSIPAQERSSSMHCSAGHAVPSTVKDPTHADMIYEMKAILKSINLKVLDSPHHIYDFFKKSGVEAVEATTPDAVLKFLGSAYRHSGDGCSIVSLPRPVSQTPLATTENTKKLLEFVSKAPEFLNSLNNLPLCLRESEVLHAFSTDEALPKPIMSEFCHLLPGSSDEFLNKRFMRFFDDCEQTSAVLQKLTLPMFVERLPLSLKDPSFSAGEPCLMDLDKFPCNNWLEDFWKFLEEQFCVERSTSQPQSSPQNLTTHENKSECTPEQQRRKAEEILKSMQNWCIIPVDINGGKMLYPIQDMHRVVFLSVNHDNTNFKLWEILQKLPLPVLDDHLLLNNLARNLVASISHPQALLHAIASCANHLSASPEHGRTILNYFETNLSSLSCQDKILLKKKLRQLPVFPSVCGNLVSLDLEDTVICVSSSIPRDGLKEWERKRKLRLLEKEYVPKDLVDFLGFQTVDDGEFYAYHLLPSLGMLPSDAILIHMKFLKDNFRWDNEDAKDLDATSKELYRQLKSAEFVDVHGILSTADKFYSWSQKVFQAMCPDQFPPAPFCEKGWKQFMTAAGMISKVNKEKLMEFAYKLEDEGKTGLSDNIKKKSEVLVGHLFERLEGQYDHDLLRNMKDIRFVLPSDWETNWYHEKLPIITVPFCIPRLVSFSESCSERDLPLVWSSSCIVHRDADPHIARLPVNLNRCGIPREVPRQKVVMHMKNITESLTGENAETIFAQLPGESSVLVDIMIKLYDYFMNAGTLSDLRDLPIVCDVKKRQMVKPSKVVFDLRDDETIEGYIEKAPIIFGKFFPLFEKLGAKKTVSANHYAVVLKCLKDICQDKPVQSNNEMMCAQKAILGLFRCLGMEDPETRKIADDNEIFLLTEEKTLHKSTELVFKNCHFGKRFSKPPSNMHFFIGFGNLGISFKFPEETLKLLPKRYKMKMLSYIVKEVVPEDIQECATEGEISRDLIQRLHQSAEAIVRLVYHEYVQSDRSFCEEQASDVKSQLNSVEVKQVVNLQTVLLMHGQLVPDSKHSKPSFAQTFSGPPCRAVVFVDVDATTKGQDNFWQLLHSLCLAVMYVTGLTDVSKFHLIEILRQPEQSMQILDESLVAPYDFDKVFETSVLPVLGQLIPCYYHRYLDNSFCDFHKNDYVGYEIYDPLVDQSDSDDNETDESVPEYIYGMVMEQTEGNADASPFAKKYRISVGVERETLVVNVTKIYKFVRKDKQESREVEHLQQAAAEDGQVPSDLQAVLREIRRLLREAWHYFTDPCDRRRVRKRLLMKWHPEKNVGNEEFCTRVTQKIFQYFQMLIDGRQLPEDDSVDEVDGASSRYTSSTFYQHMNSRACSQCADYESSCGSEGDRRPNPQPLEGKRWMRQAQADVASARATQGVFDGGRNWICYMCHQAAEKALKAVLYAKDTGLCSISHSLQGLAYSVGDSSITSLARQLEEQVGPHVRMRYPDTLVAPKIPADVFSNFDVNEALDLASQIVDRAQILLQTPE